RAAAARRGGRRGLTSLRDRVDSLLASLARPPELGLISILVALTVYAAAALPAFRTTGNADQILSNSTIIAILMALGLGAVVGRGNALLVDLVRMPAIIATLATLSIYGGLQVVVTLGS